MPIGSVVFPGTGIQDNLAHNARRLGIPVWEFGNLALLSQTRAAVARKRRRKSPEFPPSTHRASPSHSKGRICPIAAISLRKPSRLGRGELPFASRLLSNS